MKLTTALLCLAATAWGAEPQRRDATTENGYNVASLSSQLEHLTANATSGANFANISPPPKSLIGEIISAVPMTVLWELIDQESRRSLASEFSAGTTPAWYSSLPSDVKSYMSVVRSQVKAGVLTQTPTPTATGTATGSQTGTGMATATATGSSSTSSGLAAQPTAITAVVGALGVLGLALAL
ncbi:hypothetical protein N7481_012506 [Penicillium waksmanii]|uniref:uncharacterized protein n=1 Tax=Penicillium waksmanii TaxID=69791 RepID=UPI002546CBC9|nr:uncharacterized protein N7481_012506 [Penicillium waksmanii]KAJ5965792.1 hypothetical protein N7481_012506 [Penicillium waksmanii]